MKYLFLCHNRSRLEVWCPALR